MKLARIIPYLKVVGDSKIELWYHSTGKPVAFQCRVHGIRTYEYLVRPNFNGFIVGYNPKVKVLAIYNFVMNKMPRGHNLMATITTLDAIRRHDKLIYFNDIHVGGFINGFGSFHFRVPDKTDTVWPKI